MSLFRHLHDSAFLVFSRDHKHLYAACLLDLHERYFSGAPAFPTVSTARTWNVCTASDRPV